MTTSISTWNGWPLCGEARGGYIRGAVAFPLEWTAVVTGATRECLLASKGITSFHPDFYEEVSHVDSP